MRGWALGVSGGINPSPPSQKRNWPGSHACSPARLDWATRSGLRATSCVVVGPCGTSHADANRASEAKKAERFASRKDRNLNPKALHPTSPNTN